MTHRTRTLFGSHGRDLVVANALIWAALIVAISSMLQGTAQSQVLPLLVGAAVASVFLVAFGLRFVKGSPGN